MTKPLDLSSRNILVTGASSGIGRGIAIHLAKAGANIILVARNPQRLEEVCRELEPGSHSWFVCDFGEPEKIEGLFENICSSGLKLNGLVHSAGISKTIPVQLLKLEDLKNIMTVNFFSFIELVKQFSKRKYNDYGGSIVAISSISSKVGARGLSAYCASKGALDSSIRALALDLAPKNIRINSIDPGMIRTQMYEGLNDQVNNTELENELKKRQILGIGEPADVASAAAFLLSDASRFITGTALIVDGGYLAH